MVIRIAGWLRFLRRGRAGLRSGLRLGLRLRGSRPSSVWVLGAWPAGPGIWVSRGRLSGGGTTRRYNEDRGDAESEREVFLHLPRWKKRRRRPRPRTVLARPSTKPSMTLLSKAPEHGRNAHQGVQAAKAIDFARRTYRGPGPACGRATGRRVRLCDRTNPCRG